jgi:hypothetical protein
MISHQSETDVIDIRLISHPCEVHNQIQMDWIMNNRGRTTEVIHSYLTVVGKGLTSAVHSLNIMYTPDSGGRVIDRITVNRVTTKQS